MIVLEKLLFDIFKKMKRIKLFAEISRDLSKIETKQRNQKKLGYRICCNLSLDYFHLKVLK